MRIALLGAMPEEIAPLLAAIGEYTHEEYANNTYYYAVYAGHQLVIAYSRIGKVYAALSAATLLEHYKCELLLFSGIAGALNPTLKIADMMVATHLCQHDLEITAFGHPHGTVPEGSLYIPGDNGLMQVAEAVARSTGRTLYKGIIATGDQYLADAAGKAWVGKTFHADAVEMEGAAVALVCDAFDTPFLILRTISDAAEIPAGFDFDRFLEGSAQESAAFILAVVESIENATCNNQ